MDLRMHLPMPAGVTLRGLAANSHRWGSALARVVYAGETGPTPVRGTALGGNQMGRA